MQSVLKIPFTFEDGKIRTISLQDPKQGITQTEVGTFGKYVIDNQVFWYGGTLTTEVGEAYIYNTNEIPLT